MTMFDRLHENAIADIELLRLRDSSGDVFSVARDVDFSFTTGDRFRADDFSEFVNGKNFGSADVVELGPADYRVSVVIRTPVTQQVIFSLSGFMLCLSRLFGIEYDGWGSVNQDPDA